MQNIGMRSYFERNEEIYAEKDHKTGRNSYSISPVDDTYRQNVSLNRISRAPKFTLFFLIRPQGGIH